MSTKRRSLPWEVTEESLKSGVRGRKQREVPRFLDLESKGPGLKTERRNWGQSEPRKGDILV